VKVNLQRNKKGDNLNYEKMSMDVIEEKIVLMDHDVKAVKDPMRVKTIMDNTVEDYYQHRVGLGEVQLLKKITKPKPKSSSPMRKSPTNKKKEKEKNQGKYDLGWQNSIMTEGLRPQYPGYSLINEKLQKPLATTSGDKEFVKWDPYLISKRDKNRSKSPLNSNPKNIKNNKINEKYDKSLEIYINPKAKLKD